jgi:hypothetical protein
MSRGGWICKQVTIRKSDFPTAEAASVYGAMCLFRDAILETGAWTLDSEIHTGANSGVPILIDNYANVWAHGLYFVDEGGAKLSLTYSWTSSPFPAWPSGVFYATSNAGNNNCPAGLTISIIPPNCGSFSPSQLSSVTDYSPAYATPVVGTAGCESRYEYSSDNYLGRRGQGALRYMQLFEQDCGITYSFVTKPNSHCVFVFVRNTLYGADRCGMIGAGRMLSHLIHPTDNLIGTDYAWIRSGCYNCDFSNDMSAQGSPNIRVDNNPPYHTVDGCDYGGFFLGMRQAAYSDQNRTHAYNGMWKSPYQMFATPGQYLIDTTREHNTSVFGEERAMPLMVGWNNNDRKVVPGSGLKGFLDPEMILVVKTNSYQRGQTFDGGNFIYVGAGLLMPWDAELNKDVYLF